MAISAIRSEPTFYDILRDMNDQIDILDNTVDSLYFLKQELKDRLTAVLSTKDISEESSARYSRIAELIDRKINRAIIAIAVSDKIPELKEAIENSAEQKLLARTSAFLLTINAEDITKQRYLILKDRGEKILLDVNKILIERNRLKHEYEVIKHQSNLKNLECSIQIDQYNEFSSDVIQQITDNLKTIENRLKELDELFAKTPMISLANITQKAKSMADVGAAISGSYAYSAYDGIKSGLTTIKQESAAKAADYALSAFHFLTANGLLTRATSKTAQKNPKLTDQQAEPEKESLIITDISEEGVENIRQATISRGFLGLEKPKLIGLYQIGQETVLALKIEHQKHLDEFNCPEMAMSFFTLHYELSEEKMNIIIT